jgi:hypothetical protein
MNIVKNNKNYIYSLDEIYEICKMSNNNYKILEDYINNNINKELKREIYNNIFNNFLNSNTEESIQNNIKSIKIVLKFSNKDLIAKLINEITKKLDIFNYNKIIYSSLKSLSIYCNKYLQHNTDTKIDNFKKIESIIDSLKTVNKNNTKRIQLYLNKIINYIQTGEKKNIDYTKIINICKTITDNELNKNNSSPLIYTLLKLINICKSNIENPENDLENILRNVDNEMYNYIYYLNNNDNLFNEKERSLSFVLNLDYKKKSFKDIDKLNLKRGFIQGLTKNNKNYLLKYQPNKSVMELILNTELAKIDKKYFLTPEQIFINSDNSYFYIIEKYSTDLYKYFNILEEHKQLLDFSNILHIISFLINSIIILYKNNIVHCDFKLENIIVNVDKKNNKIHDLKIIDFDVGVYNKIPEKLESVSEKYLKILNNKKPRGTRIYMLKDKNVTFNNDIYSLGVISLILLYKSIKLIVSVKKKIFKDEDENCENFKKVQKNKRDLMKYQNVLKNLNNLRESIEDNKSKIKMLNTIDLFFSKNKKNITFFKDNYEKFKMYKEFILDCLNNKLNIIEINEKYTSLFS